MFSLIFACSMMVKLCNTVYVFLCSRLFIYLFFSCFFFFDGNVSMIYLRQTFLQEVIIDFVLPSVFLKVLLIFTRCKCLLTIFLILGREGLHVTEKGMMSTRIDFKFSKKCLLSRLSTLLIWLCILVFLIHFCINCFNWFAVFPLHSSSVK